MALWSKKDKKQEVAPAAPSAPNGAVETKAKPAAATVSPVRAGPAPAAPSQPGAAETQQGELASARLLFRLGEVVSVLMRAPQFRSVPLGEIQALVLPPLISGQFLVAEARSKSRGVITPVAIALWAKVSEEVDKRLSAELDKPIRLAPKEWNSGDIAWLIVLAGNAQAIAPMLKRLGERTLNRQPLKMRSKGKDGQMVVSTFQAAPRPT
jgi:hemolysin-activating ACP:hemolysin acyltransferase